MKKLQTIALLIMLSIATAFGQKTGDFDTSYVESGTGATRTFSCHVPINYNSANQYPVIFMWHGGGGSSTVWRDRLKAANNQIGAIIICPSHNGLNSSQRNEMNNNIKQFTANYNIDSTKTIVMGHSSGGYYAYNIGLNQTSYFKGIIGINHITSFNLMTQAMWSQVQNIRIANIAGTANGDYTDAKLLSDSIVNLGGNSMVIQKPGVSHDDAAYFSSAEFKTDLYAAYLYIVGTQTNIKEKKLQSIFAYPNPANNYIYIDNMQHFQNVNFLIFNFIGEIVKIGKINNNSINIEDLETGVYLLKLNYNSKSETIKFIKE